MTGYPAAEAFNEEHLLLPITLRSFLKFTKYNKQDVQSPEGMKFPHFSRLRLISYVCLRVYAPPDNFQNQGVQIS